MKSNVDKLKILLSGNEEFMAKENGQINLLLKNIVPKDIPEDFKNDIKELIDVMRLTDNVSPENIVHLDEMYKKLEEGVK